MPGRERRAGLDVDEGDVGVVARGEHLRRGRSDVPGADNRDLAARLILATDAGEERMQPGSLGLVKDGHGKIGRAHV